MSFNAFIKIMNPYNAFKTFEQLNKNVNFPVKTNSYGALLKSMK